MEMASSSSIIEFLRERGFDEKAIHEMLKKCKHLQGLEKEIASENWNYLKSKVGIEERKLPSVVLKCPRILTLSLNDKLVPMVQFLTSLAKKPTEVASVITKFPHILCHSVEEKLCPLLAFFEAQGVPETQLGKLVLLNPRLVSYSIESKLTQIVDFLASLGLNKKEGLIGKVLLKNPFIMGYSVEKRLRPTSEFLKTTVGLTELDIQRVAISFPQLLSRDVEKILRPNWGFLKGYGFGDEQIAALVSGYPQILIKSIHNSLEPRIRFLVEVMERRIDEVVEYPDFFRHGLKKRLELRQRVLKQNNNMGCSLREMLECNHSKFSDKFGLISNNKLT